jgi:hypothetical protein
MGASRWRGLAEHLMCHGWRQSEIALPPRRDPRTVTMLLTADVGASGFACENAGSIVMFLLGRSR